MTYIVGCLEQNASPSNGPSPQSSGNRKRLCGPHGNPQTVRVLSRQTQPYGDILGKGLSQKQLVHPSRLWPRVRRVVVPPLTKEISDTCTATCPVCRRRTLELYRVGGDLGGTNQHYLKCRNCGTNHFVRWEPVPRGIVRKDR